MFTLIYIYILPDRQRESEYRVVIIGIDNDDKFGRIFAGFVNNFTLRELSPSAVHGKTQFRVDLIFGRNAVGSTYPCCGFPLSGVVSRARDGKREAKGTGKREAEGTGKRESGRDGGMYARVRRFAAKKENKWSKEHDQFDTSGTPQEREKERVRKRVRKIE